MSNRSRAARTASLICSVWIIIGLSANYSDAAGINGYEAPPPDQTLWSEARIAAYAESLKAETGPTLGVLAIPRFNLEVPIYNGASDLHMDRGIARLKGTELPGHVEGNLGISGHRDGYFRVLKDIEQGDEISIRTSSGVQIYVVEKFMIVEPADVTVLKTTTRPTVTIVTCFPFYFVGHAPERFIVQAVLREEEATLTSRRQ
jgi:sortase A